MQIDFKLTAGRDRHIYAAAKFFSGQLKLVPYSTNLFNVVEEGKETPKTPSGVHVRLTVKVAGSAPHIVTMSAATAAKPDKSSKPFEKKFAKPSHNSVI